MSMSGNQCTVELMFGWFGIVCFAIKTEIVSCHTADSNPVKEEVNRSVILPPLVFPVYVEKFDFSKLNVEKSNNPAKYFLGKKLNF